MAVSEKKLQGLILEILRKHPDKYEGLAFGEIKYGLGIEGVTAKRMKLALYKLVDDNEVGVSYAHAEGKGYQKFRIKENNEMIHTDSEYDEANRSTIPGQQRTIKATDQEIIDLVGKSAPLTIDEIFNHFPAVTKTGRRTFREKIDKMVTKNQLRVIWEEMGDSKTPRKKYWIMDRPVPDPVDFENGEFSDSNTKVSSVDYLNYNEQLRYEQGKKQKGEKMKSGEAREKPMPNIIGLLSIISEHGPITVRKLYDVVTSNYRMAEPTLRVKLIELMERQLIQRKLPDYTGENVRGRKKYEYFITEDGEEAVKNNEIPERAKRMRKDNMYTSFDRTRDRGMSSTLQGRDRQTFANQRIGSVQCAECMGKHLAKLYAQKQGTGIRKGGNVLELEGIEEVPVMRELYVQQEGGDYYQIHAAWCPSCHKIESLD